MTDKAPFDLDAALSALAADERAAQPAVSASLQMRVLGDAATVAASRAEAASQQRNRARSSARNPGRKIVQNAARAGGFRLFGLFDAWSGGAIAAIAVCLVAGLGVGYAVGPESLAQAGFGDAELASAADDGDGMFLSEDVL